MTGTRDRFGELIEPLEDDSEPVTPIRPRPTRKAHIAELRAILRAARDRREAQQ